MVEIYGQSLNFLTLAGIAGGFLYVDNLAAGVPIGLLGLLLLVQVKVKVAIFGNTTS